MLIIVKRFEATAKGEEIILTMAVMRLTEKRSEKDEKKAQEDENRLMTNT